MNVRNVWNKVKEYAGRGLALVGIGSASAHAADAVTSLDGFASVGKGYITTGQEVAIAAAGLSLGWVAVRIVRKYTGKA